MSSGREQTWLLPTDLSAVIEARDHVADVCAGLPVEDSDVARLLVTELVANALQHGSGEVVLVVAREGRAVRVEVLDGNPAMPAPTRQRSLAERGWGLQLVEGLANSWGALPREDGQPGKRVWFTLS